MFGRAKGAHLPRDRVHFRFTAAYADDARMTATRGQLSALQTMDQMLAAKRGSLRVEELASLALNGARIFGAAVGAFEAGTGDHGDADAPLTAEDRASALGACRSAEGLPDAEAVTPEQAQWLDVLGKAATNSPWFWLLAAAVDAASDYLHASLADPARATSMADKTLRETARVDESRFWLAVRLAGLLTHAVDTFRARQPPVVGDTLLNGLDTHATDLRAALAAHALWLRARAALLEFHDAPLEQGVSPPAAIAAARRAGLLLRWAQEELRKVSGTELVVTTTRGETVMLRLPHVGVPRPDPTRMDPFTVMRVLEVAAEARERARADGVTSQWTTSTLDAYLWVCFLYWRSVHDAVHAAAVLRAAVRMGLLEGVTADMIAEWDRREDEELRELPRGTVVSVELVSDMAEAVDGAQYELGQLRAVCTRGLSVLATKPCHARDQYGQDAQRFLYVPRGHGRRG